MQHGYTFQSGIPLYLSRPSSPREQPVSSMHQSSTTSSLSYWCLEALHAASQCKTKNRTLPTMTRLARSALLPQPGRIRGVGSKRRWRSKKIGKPITPQNTESLRSARCPPQTPRHPTTRVLPPTCHAAFLRGQRPAFLPPQFRVVDLTNQTPASLHRACTARVQQSW